jgi:hypothetical protein
MTKQNCKTCEKEFVIRDEDLVFYEQMKVPAPEFCPDCRLQQRTSWRNEKSLYRRNCDLCQKQIISIYSTDKPHKVYCRECYHGDKWDPLSFGLDLDFTKPFLEQHHELMLKVPRILSFIFQNVSSEYLNGAAFNKNCYMIFVSDHNEDSMYVYNTYFTRTSSDLLNCFECELCYEDISCSKCYQTSFSEDCSTSQNLIFCRNCVNCQDCIGCVNQRNIRYGIFNKVYGKEEYFERAKSYNLNTREGIIDFNKKFREFIVQFPVKYMHGIRNIDVAGDDTINSKNSSYVFDSEELEDCKFVNYGNKSKTSYDSYVIVERSEHVYGVLSGITLNNVINSSSIWSGYDILYSDTCENSHHLFGCVGLRKKEYCILNKQYTKEEYEKIVPKIIEHMKKMPFRNSKGVLFVYGDFFAQELSPFAYNETVAQEYFPLNEEEALNRGFKWKKEERRKYTPTISSENIPNNIQKVDNKIMEDVIECTHKGNCKDGCTTAFKLTQAEIDLYRRINVPIPILCFNCRHGERIRKRNPKKFWQRNCMCKNEKHHNHSGIHCSDTFETTYSPDRPEVIYCEKCYQQEVA